MQGIALLVPDEDMYREAESLLAERAGHHVLLVRHIHTTEAIQEARDALAQGAGIIVARGKQAHIIRASTNLPVVDIRMTAQELGLLIRQGQCLLGRRKITVGLFGWDNMFCDTAHFNELFDIDLRIYNFQDDADWQKNLDAARRDGCELILGGRAAARYSDLLGVPYLYLRGTRESLSAALDMAEALYQMSEREQHQQAQFNAVLYSATSGIVKIDASGRILLLNRTMEELLGAAPDSLPGSPLRAILPAVDEEKLRALLAGKLENYSCFASLQNCQLLVVAEPITVEGHTDGAIISCTQLVQQGAAERASIRDQLLRSDIALANFDALGELFPDLAPAIERAKIYALSPSPMLIEATSGPELDMLAQSIHNGSIRKNGPFIIVSLPGLTDEQQTLLLFGNRRTGERGALLDANHGTLVLHGIDKLTLPLQQRLVKVLRSKKISPDTNPTQVKLVDVHLIATTGKDLSELRQHYRFRSDLLFMLNALRLRVPPLSERPRDIGLMLDHFIRDFSRRYSAYHVLTDGARQALVSYPWEGNVIQLQAFCERMILTVQKRAISEAYVRGLIAELYGDPEGRHPSVCADDTPASKGKKSENTADPIRRLIAETLKKNNGSRKKTAAELRMSTSTLWRKLKAYGLE